jgi:uncharacterized protein
MATSRPLAVITAASHGIGFELARQCASHGYDLFIAADGSLGDAIQELECLGARVEAVKADPGDLSDVDELLSTLGDRPVEVLFANAGHGLGKAFLDQDFDDILHVVDTNITGTLHLIHSIARGMRERQSGRIVITGSIAGFMPGTRQAVFRATSAFVESFSWALRDELADSGVTVTCLMPGHADGGMFGREDLPQAAPEAKARGIDKMDPAEVARIGFAAVSNLTPASIRA